VPSGGASADFWSPRDRLRCRETGARRDSLAHPADATQAQNERAGPATARDCLWWVQPSKARSGGVVHVVKHRLGPEKGRRAVALRHVGVALLYVLGADLLRSTASLSIVRQRRCIGPEPDMTASKPQIPTSDGQREALDSVRHPSRRDRRAAVPPALVSDIDRILLDHRIDLPKADIKAALAWLLSGSYGDAIGGPSSP
jgi:hypothetical protein